MMLQKNKNHAHIPQKMQAWFHIKPILQNSLYYYYMVEQPCPPQKVTGIFLLECLCYQRVPRT